MPKTSGIQPILLRAPPDVISFNFVLPKLLVYNSSYMESIIYV
jgi:hypothetical protein